MSKITRTLFALAVLTGPAATGAGAQAAKLPPGLATRKPHEVVELILNAKADLALTETQVARLTAWHEQVADEPHRFKHDPTKKPHDVTHQPMIGRQVAYDSAVVVLTPEQRTRLAQLFRTPADGIPLGLASLKPHAVIERILNKQADLALTPEQVAHITAWHEQVADEPHRFKHDPTKKPHDVTHQPMVSRHQAFDSTMAMLTPEQRTRVLEVFQAVPTP